MPRMEIAMRATLRDGRDVHIIVDDNGRYVGPDQKGLYYALGVGDSNDPIWAYRQTKGRARSDEHAYVCMPFGGRMVFLPKTLLAEDIESAYGGCLPLPLIMQGNRDMTRDECEPDVLRQYAKWRVNVEGD